MSLAPFIYSLDLDCVKIIFPMAYHTWQGEDKHGCHEQELQE